MARQPQNATPGGAAIWTSLKFTGAEDFTQQTSFVIDDTALNVA